MLLMAMLLIAMSFVTMMLMVMMLMVMMLMAMSLMTMSKTSTSTDFPKISSCSMAAGGREVLILSLPSKHQKMHQIFI